MKKIFTILTGNGLSATFSVIACFLAVTSTNAAQMPSARVTQIIQDVKLLPSNAAPRPAAVNDDVRQGTAVRTGQDSRTELTFTDKTLTRLGANSVFSFDSGAGIFNLGQGSILMQVPPNGSSVKVKTAAVTAAITGGTAIFGTGPPAKFMVLEGTGTFYPNDHPDEAMILHGGEMVTLGGDGHMYGPTTFNVKVVMETSELIVPFDDLANLSLIWDVILGQLGNAQIAFNDLTQIDETDQAQNAMPTPAPSESPGSPSKFGQPSTISSPDPYVITSGTQIQTDPSITTNGVTDLGKIYRGPALDGSEYEYLFGSTSSFDSTIGTFFNTNGNGVPVAVFKFSHLQLTGDPTITIAEGATTFLGLVSVGDVTSGAPGGTLSFAGLDRLFIATQNGSINLGPEIGFSGIGHVTFYARGPGSNLTLGSAISGAAVVHLDAEGAVQINGNITASTDFRSFSGGDFLAGSGIITTTNIDIQSLANVNIDANQFPDFTGDANFVSGNTLSITLSGEGTFSGASLTGTGTTINLQGDGIPHTFDLGSANVLFIAGSGGIQAPNVLFANGSSLLLQTTNSGNINIYGRQTPSNDTGGNVAVGTIDAGGAFSAVSDVTNVQDLTAGTSIMVGGTLASNNITAGTTIDVGGQLFADNVTAGGNITANGVGVITINAPTSILTAGSGGIFAEVTDGGAAVQNTFNISSIVSPNGIDFSGNHYGGINGLSSGGLLTINANTLTFDSATGIGFANFNGADAGGFDGKNPSNAGDGGTFVVNATGNITAVAGATIIATTGLNQSGDSGFSGAGGTVSLNSSAGTVSVNDAILVSSDDPVPNQAPPLPPIRRSASGGNINIISTKTTGIAINIGSAAQLLSLLDAAAPGPGGNITIRAGTPPGGNTNGVTEGGGDTSSINIDNGLGQIVADRGTVDITHYGDSGIINISNANIRADVIKITAFGVNGTLNIGGGTISADTMLKLYAAGSNGSINFVANVTLNSKSTATLIQAVSVTIFNGVIVTITGPAPAEVFTDHPNYSSTDTSGNPTGGNDNTTGKFAGSGANTTGFSGPTPTPSGTPSKFGPPTTIASPVPYLITSNTVIQTDPAITTNGVTDYGKIWRGTATDGPLSAFIFGSTSSFDTASGFDTVIGGNGSGAGFKFTALQLTGDPTISTTNGEINFGLIAVNGITSGAPGGVLTFAGIRGLLLATQNGPITLGSEISFSGLHDINIYARGPVSDLTLGSDISTSRRVFLLAERDMFVASSITTEELIARTGRNILLTDPAVLHAEMIELSAGQDLTWNGQTSDETALNSDGDVSISAGNQISIINALEIDRRFGDSSFAGLNISFTAGTDLTAGNGITILVDNSFSGDLDSGASVTFEIGGNLTVNGTGGLSLTIDNSNGGFIGTGGNITVTTGGNLTADSIFAFINNRNGGTIDSGGNVTFSVGGALTTTGDAAFITSNRSLGGGGGTMGANVTLALHAVSFSVGGDLTAAISTNAGGHIVGSAFNNITIDGNVTIQGTAQIDIENSGILVSPGNFVGGGTIGSDAVLNITAGNIFVGGSFFDVGISYDSGALIGGNALVNFAVSGNVTTPGEESFTIGKSNNDGVTNAGTIGSNAIINVSAASISTGGRLIGEIDNTGGSIGESAIINFSLSGNLTTQSDATFSIYNSNGGAIGLDAVMSVSAGGVSVDGNLTATINNRDGSIGGDSAIIFDLSDLNVSGNASFTIAQTPVALRRTVSGFSSISSIDVTANSITVGGDLNAYIDNSFNGGTTLDDGNNVHLESFGGINVTGRLNVLGTVLADGDVNVGTLSVTNLDTQGNNTIVGAGGITPFSIPGQLAPDILHTLTTRLLSSAGGINFDGVPADGDFSIATNAGALTINALILSFGPTGNIMNGVSFNGGDGSFTFDPGNGGTFTVNATSDITVDSDIEATSGRIQPGKSPSGDGGEVNLNSSNGTVTVNNRIQVSSAEPSSTIAPVRQSAKGGRIGITSAKTTGVAINIGSSAQLLSLLNAAAPGPGGSIKIVASKAGSNATNSSSININNANGDPGAIVADRGTVEIRHDGDNGAININNANIRADVVKVGALGLNGTLNIGGGNISADTILKLYATGSNGQLNFISDVTLSSGTAMHLAANTITIQPSIIVTINGTGGPANVYTNHPNYSGFGGTIPTNGTFAGNGAHNPQALGNAPGF